MSFPLGTKHLSKNTGLLREDRLLNEKIEFNNRDNMSLEDFLAHNIILYYYYYYYYYKIKFM